MEKKRQAQEWKDYLKRQIEEKKEAQLKEKIQKEFEDKRNLAYQMREYYPDPLIKRALELVNQHHAVIKPMEHEPVVHHRRKTDDLSTKAIYSSRIPVSAALKQLLAKEAEKAKKVKQKEAHTDPGPSGVKNTRFDESTIQKQPKSTRLEERSGSPHPRALSHKQDPIHKIDHRTKHVYSKNENNQKMDTDHQPIRPKVNTLDRQESKRHLADGHHSHINEQPVMSKPVQSFDDQPIKTKQINFDDQPIKTKQINFDNQPIKTKQINFDDQPIRPRPVPSFEEQRVPITLKPSSPFGKRKIVTVTKTAKGNPSTNRMVQLPIQV